MEEFAEAYAHAQTYGAATAEQLAQTVEKAVERLSDNPDIARMGRDSDTREIVLRKFPYILVYRRRGQDLLIVALRHTARRWPASFPTT